MSMSTQDYTCDLSDIDSQIKGQQANQQGMNQSFPCWWITSQLEILPHHCNITETTHSPVYYSLPLYTSRVGRMKAALYLFLSMQSHQMLVCAAYFLPVTEHLHQESSRLLKFYKANTTEEKGQTESRNDLQHAETLFQTLCKKHLFLCFFYSFCNWGTPKGCPWQSLLRYDYFVQLLSSSAGFELKLNFKLWWDVSFETQETLWGEMLLSLQTFWLFQLLTLAIFPSILIHHSFKYTLVEATFVRG